MNNLSGINPKKEKPGGKNEKHRRLNKSSYKPLLDIYTANRNIPPQAGI